ncbi:MAG: hypothetical protein HQL75_13590, partial [Magnetococcales bacterium]|nr:hypothetical protein [Magnetococcales bacterium]
MDLKSKILDNLTVEKMGADLRPIAMMEDQTEKNRSQYDTTLKDLFEHPPQRLLQILIGREAVELLTVEFASTQKRLPDLLFLLKDDSIFHLELQSSSEGMDWRMLMYYSLIRQRYP